jgi:hypothetical protein
MVFPGPLFDDVYAALTQHVTTDELKRIVRTNLDEDFDAHVNPNAKLNAQIFDFLDWCNRQDLLLEFVQAVSTEYPRAADLNAILGKLQALEQAGPGAVKPLGTNEPFSITNKSKSAEHSTFSDGAALTSRSGEGAAYRRAADDPAKTAVINSPVDAAKAFDAAANVIDKKAPPIAKQRKLAMMETHIAQLDLVVKSLRAMEALNTAYHPYGLG